MRRSDHFRSSGSTTKQELKSIFCKSSSVMQRYRRYKTSTSWHKIRFSQGTSAAAGDGNSLLGNPKSLFWRPHKVYIYMQLGHREYCHLKNDKRISRQSKRETKVFKGTFWVCRTFAFCPNTFKPSSSWTAKHILSCKHYFSRSKFFSWQLRWKFRTFSFAFFLWERAKSIPH